MGFGILEQIGNTAGLKNIVGRPFYNNNSLKNAGESVKNILGTGTTPLCLLATRVTTNI
jgi:hypothetical protein